MFCIAFELLLLGGPNCMPVKIGLVAFLTVEKKGSWPLWGSR